MRSRRSRAVLSVLLGLVVILGFVVWKGSTSGEGSYSTGQLNPGNTAGEQTVDPETGLSWIDVSVLPPQGRAVLAMIDEGGPYPYSQDGGTFTNAERLLPPKAKGFYTEYTVKLPSSSDRGPVRIIMGGKGQWYFWTADHYSSFSRIRR